MYYFCAPLRIRIKNMRRHIERQPHSSIYRFFRKAPFLTVMDTNGRKIQHTQDFTTLHAHASFWEMLFRGAPIIMLFCLINVALFWMQKYNFWIFPPKYFQHNLACFYFFQQNDKSLLLCRPTSTSPLPRTARS